MIILKKNLWIDDFDGGADDDVDKWVSTKTINDLC